MTMTLDGRNIDLSLGVLEGEGSQAKVKKPDDANPLHGHSLPLANDGAATATRGYYSLAPIKPVPWKWWIPTYFFLGGLAGACSTLGSAALVVGRGSMRDLEARARWIATGALVVGAGCLIADLGRPSRFIDMMRVFRPSSPMNMGTWVLAGTGAATSLAASSTLGSPGLQRLGNVAGVISGGLGLPLAGYTAVLVGNTAVPVWQHTRNALPALFVASAMASAGSAFDLTELGGPSRRAARVYGIAGKIGELAAAEWVAREARKHPAVGRPFERGTSAVLWTAARALTFASLGLSLFARSRPGRLLSGALGLAGAVATRFAIVEAGKQSAMDPEATILPQRAAAVGA